MTEHSQHDHGSSHGDYERRDIGATGVLYFIVGLAAATLFLHFVLAGLYTVLDRYSRSHQPALSPLVENAPVDTRKVAPHYPEQAFPEPRLETDERGQLNDIRLGEEEKLNSYGWVDEKAGTVRIPIERAMELEAQRLPVRPQGTGTAKETATTTKK